MNYLCIFANMFIYFAPGNNSPSRLAVIWFAAKALHISSVSRKQKLNCIHGLWSFRRAVCHFCFCSYIAIHPFDSNRARTLQIKRELWLIYTECVSCSSVRNPSTSLQTVDKNYIYHLDHHTHHQ